jgi:hypothetical protein
MTNRTLFTLNSCNYFSNLLRKLVLNLQDTPAKNNCAGAEIRYQRSVKTKSYKKRFCLRSDKYDFFAVASVQTHPACFFSLNPPRCQLPTLSIKHSLFPVNERTQKGLENDIFFETTHSIGCDSFEFRFKITSFQIFMDIIYEITLPSHT